LKFHLRVFIKALLGEFEKTRRKTAVVLGISEGVTGMITREIMGAVGEVHILKLFR
jgi:hypothetical protein